MNIIWRPSPNFTPANDPKFGRLSTEFLVIHSTAGTSSLGWLTNPKSQVSSHYLISKDGTVYQLVKEEDVAWHAGVSSWNGKSGLNRYSIGIELENKNSGTDPFPPEQISAVTELSNDIRKRHNITPANVVAHYQISPGRKTDPQGFNMDLLRQPLNITITDTILNGIQTDPIRLHRALNKYSPALSTQEKESIVSAYTAFGELTTIGNLYPFAQAAKETAWFASERWVKSRNPAGLGADDTGAWGGHFNSVAEGVLAQYAHLLCYAVPDEQLATIQKMIARISPRRVNLIGAYGLGASGNRWQGLSLKWNSPTGNKNYGQEIINLGEKILAL